MCGIAGCFAYDDTKKILAKMSDAMTHRGPDGAGETSFTDKGVKIGLAHRRLAIIDRKAGKQPMKSVNNPDYEIVYNFGHL